MSGELWTVIVDAGVSVALVAVGIWAAPEYRELAFTTVAGLQAVAGALIVEFRGQRRAEQVRAEVRAEIKALER